MNLATHLRILPLAVLCCLPSLAQTTPAFDVATIKPSAPEEHVRSMGPDGRRFKANFATISQITQFAYSLHEKQILNAPDWFDTTTYDLEVQADAANPTADQWRAILQQMLSERFHLTFHHEQKIMPAYVMTVAKSGAKLDPPKDDGEIFSGVYIQRGPHQLVRAIGVRGTMQQLAAQLQRVETDRPVVDHTGLAGTFNFTLSATSSKPYFAGETPDTSDNAPPNLFTAMQEQLGLKLEAQKTAVDCFVLDRADHPSAN